MITRRATLKVASTTFLLVCFVCRKERTCKTRKNTFYFTSKALRIFEIIKFYYFSYSNIMMSSNTHTWDIKHILLNNLGSKCSPVMKFGQFMPYYKIIFFIEKLYEKCGLEASSRPFLILCKKILWRSAYWFGQILIELLLQI